MRLRLVSVVGEFLWSGEQPVDTQKHVPRWDLPAGLAGAQLGVKTPLPIHEGASRHICNASQSISIWLVIDRRVDYTETCTLLGPSCRVGGHPAGGKDPRRRFMKQRDDTYNK